MLWQQFITLFQSRNFYQSYNRLSSIVFFFPYSINNFSSYCLFHIYSFIFIYQWFYNCHRFTMSFSSPHLFSFLLAIGYYIAAHTYQGLLEVRNPSCPLSFACQYSHAFNLVGLYELRVLHHHFSYLVRFEYFYCYYTKIVFCSSKNSASSGICILKHVIL